MNEKRDEILWWGYLHSNGTIQVKRWYGDTKDYTDDCEDNPFIVRVVPPFNASCRLAAEEIVIKQVLEPLPHQQNDGIRRIEKLKS